jgi:hypothetical protein
MSLQLIAKQMEAKGRKGDSMLVHMTPEEVAGLQKLAESAGGSLTVNPETGLVEANFLKRMLPTLAGIGVGMFAGPMAGAAAGALVGGMTAPKNQREMGILMGALGGYGGAGIGAGLGASAAGTAAGSAANIAAPGAGAIATGAGSQASMLAAQNAGFGAQGLGLMAEAAKVPASTAALNTAKAGLSGLGQEAGRNAFMQSIGGVGGLAKTAGIAAAPMMMEDRKQAEVPTDDEMIVYDYDVGRTGAELNPSATSAERKYFDGRYSTPRRVRAKDYFNAAEGGEVADAAPMDAGIAGGMSGASKAAFDYLMGNAASSAPQGIAAPAVRSAPVVGGDNMYAFDPATGAFIRNPNYVDPASGTRNAGLIGQLISGGVSGGDYQPVGPNPDFDTPEKQAAYYRENPTMGAITRAGQTALSYTPMNLFARAVAPEYMAERALNAEQITRGISAPPSAGAGYVADNSLEMGGNGGGSGFTDAGGGSFDYSADTGYDSFSNDYAGYDSSRGDFAAGGLMGLAKGGMKSGGFVVPADVVSMVGEGNTDAGYSRIKSMIPGATAIKGKDGGQADTVKTSIEGKQPARVAHGEMYIPPETVKRMGGAKKLYAMMDRVREQATGSKKQIKPVSLKRAMA